MKGSWLWETGVGIVVLSVIFGAIIWWPVMVLNGAWRWVIAIPYWGILLLIFIGLIIDVVEKKRKKEEH